MYSKSIAVFASINPREIVCSVPANIGAPSLWPTQSKPVNIALESFLLRNVASSESNPGPASHEYVSSSTIVVWWRGLPALSPPSQ